MAVRSLACAVLLLTWAPSVQAWHSSGTAYPPPPVPRCDEVMARHGDRGVWIGHFSGKYGFGEVDTHGSYGRVGCFLSEAECRRWLGQNMSFAPFVIVSTCRPAGGRAR